MPDAPTDQTDAHAAALAAAATRALDGNLATGAEKLAQQNKLFVRDRLARLLDPDSFVEDALLANASATDLPADGVVTGVGRVEGRPVPNPREFSRAVSGVKGPARLETDQGPVTVR